MNKPLDFLIIGAQKAGTTSLWSWLRQHPDVFLSPAKEIHYWTRDEFWKLGPSYLDPFYEDLGDELIVGGSYVHMLYLKNAPERVREYNPNMKVIACVRDPVARAYSAYWFARLNGWEPAETFEEALTLESSRAGGSDQDRTELTYAGHGHYGEQLRRWIEVLGSDQVHIVVSDDLRADPTATLAGVTDWLGVSPCEFVAQSSSVNGAAVARYPALQKVLMGESVVKRLARKLTSPGLRWKLQKHVIDPLSWWNRDYATYPPIDPGTRERLVAQFEPHIQDLEQILNRDLSPWRVVTASST